MNKSASKIFVNKLKLILEYKGVSNAKTEQETNISQGYISKLISSEEAANPSLKLIESLSNYFGIPITALIDENFYPFNKDEKKVMPIQLSQIIKQRLKSLDGKNIFLPI